MRFKISYLLLTLSLFFAVQVAVGQYRDTKLVDVRVVPENANWEAKVGKPVNFKVSVVREKVELKDVKLEIRHGKEMLTNKMEKQSVEYKGGEYVVKSKGLKEPGFYSCEVWVEVDGRRYHGQAKVGVEPEKIVAVAKLPSDFTQFWDDQKERARKTPLNPIMILAPELSTSSVDVYYVNFQNDRAQSRIYGVLSIPKGGGDYPAILTVPGAGARPYVASLNEKFITLNVGIHGVPVNFDNQVYQGMMSGPIADYWLINSDNKESYYYRRVYLGMVRAVDFIFTLPQFDGRVAVSGGSQGGALAVITASLDQRVMCYTSNYPALCDLTGYLHDRAGGWPGMFRDGSDKGEVLAKKVETLQYFDVVNFARTVKSPGFFSWGYNDNTCPPTSMYAAYNAVEAPKELKMALETAHWTFYEQVEWKHRFIKGVMGME